MTDAVVIGSGPNGLVAANLLADRGWSVTVLESQPTPGGAVRSAELIEPGFTNDVCSAFYPLAAASPTIQALHLEDHGLRWCHAPTVLAHPTRDGACPVIDRDLDVTCASLDAHHAGDGEAWRGPLRPLARDRGTAPRHDPLAVPAGAAGAAHRDVDVAQEPAPAHPVHAAAGAADGRGGVRRRRGPGRCSPRPRSTPTSPPRPR